MNAPATQAVSADRNGLYWLAASLIVILAAALRLYRLDQLSLTLDESTLFRFAQSVLEHGYPVVPVGSQQVQLATYELMPYIMAPFIWLLGTSDFVIRLPSVLFAIGTAYLVFSAGCKWFGLRAGVLAGLLYATMPWTIYWGQNAFHPSVAQFFALLTLIQAARLLEPGPVPVRTPYLTALFFSCAFLSWEGIGFLLPILLILALVLRWNDWSWLKNPHVGYAAAIVALVVVGQGVRRALLVDNYLFVGSGRGDVALPELAMLQPYYSPYIYADQIFGRYPQFVVGIVFGLGLLFLGRHWHFRLLSLFVATSIIVMANLLTFYSYHYIYFVMPAFCLCVGAATVMFVDWLAARANLAGGAIGSSSLVLLMLGALELSTAGAYGLKLYNSSDAAAYPDAPGTRLGVTNIDYRGLGSYFREHYVDGDPIIGFAPFSLQQYTGHSGDMLLENWTYVRVVFDPGGDRIHYSEKYVGGTVIRNRREFREVLSRNERVWIVVQPWQMINSLIDANTLSDLLSRAELVNESFDGRLYLWTR